MSKLSESWRRWRLCYRENGLRYTLKKTFNKIRQNLSRKKTASVQILSKPKAAHIDVSTDSKFLNIGIQVKGGIGDYVIAANYIHHFKEKYYIPCMKIDIFYNRNKDAMTGIIDSGLADRLFFFNGDLDKNIFRKYDLFINLVRYPEVVNRNPSKFSVLQPKLLEYCQAAEHFKWRNSRLFNNVCYDGQGAMLSKINGTTRIQQPDIYGILNITQHYDHKIKVRENSDLYLSSLGLAADAYIAVVNTADVRYGSNNNNKLWPMTYWDVLIQMIKEKYPKLKIILLGDTFNFEYRLNVDLDLSGKTSFEDAKVLLKYALLLISSEGGMVHLRHALTDKKSIVLFGPTDKDFFGYADNINLCGNGCKYSCEWFCPDWTNKCFNPWNRACMRSLSPRFVMNAVKDFLEENYNGKQEDN